VLEVVSRAFIGFIHFISSIPFTVLRGVSFSSHWFSLALCVVSLSFLIGFHLHLCGFVRVHLACASSAVVSIEFCHLMREAFSAAVMLGSTSFATSLCKRLAIL